MTSAPASGRNQYRCPSTSSTTSSPTCQAATIRGEERRRRSPAPGQQPGDQRIGARAPAAGRAPATVGSKASTWPRCAHHARACPCASPAPPARLPRTVTTSVPGSRRLDLAPLDARRCESARRAHRAEIIEDARPGRERQRADDRPRRGRFRAPRTSTCRTWKKSSRRRAAARRTSQRRAASATAEDLPAGLAQAARSHCTSSRPTRVMSPAPSVITTSPARRDAPESGPGAGALSGSKTTWRPRPLRGRPPPTGR